MTMMNVELVDSMGSDLSVVNAARVSMDKESEWELIGEREVQIYPDLPSDVQDKLAPMMIDVYGLKEGDKKLISYLARHKHWTPFAHTTVSLRLKAPIFVARQLGKHQVGLVWNEVSRRYVDSPPEFYLPEVWRERAENVKQGSKEEGLKEDVVGGTDLNYFCKAFYYDLLDSGVCPEQARMVLPQSMMTEWIWTGNLVALANMCKLRLDSHTQKETRDVAQMVNDIIGPLYPVSWKELMDV
jgi:thymidylate synthase (FAD)